MLQYFRLTLVPYFFVSLRPAFDHFRSDEAKSMLHASFITLCAHIRTKCFPCRALLILFFSDPIDVGVVFTYICMR